MRKVERRAVVEDLHSRPLELRGFGVPLKSPDDRACVQDQGREGPQLRPARQQILNISRLGVPVRQGSEDRRGDLRVGQVGAPERGLGVLGRREVSERPRLAQATEGDQRPKSQPREAPVRRLGRTQGIQPCQRLERAVQLK